MAHERGEWVGESIFNDATIGTDGLDIGPFLDQGMSPLDAINAAKATMRLHDPLLQRADCTDINAAQKARLDNRHLETNNAGRTMR